jgi:iron complex outermembrane receptor protein
LNPAAGTTYPAPYTSVDDVYFDASGLRKDYLGAVGIEAPVTSGIKASIKGYFHNNDGQGTWFTPYVPSPTGVPISVRTTEYRMRRKGVFGDFGGDTALGNFTVGGWYERNDFNQARRFYGLESRQTPGRSAFDFLKNPFFTQWEFDYVTDIYQYYVRDKFKVGALTVDAGWKGFDVKNSAAPIIQAGRAAGEIRARDWFQPSVGLNYRVTSAIEAYGSFSQSTEAYVAAFTSGPFSTTQAGFDAIKDSLKPESSDTFELGARFKRDGFRGSLGAYLVNFHNRLLGITSGAGIVGNPVVLQNVGDVRSAGLEAVADYRMDSGVGLFASYSYNDATYRDNVHDAQGSLLAATKGKTVVDAPRHMFKVEARYDPSSGVFGRVGLDYISKRFFTYTNDQSVPGRFLADATLGYRFMLGSKRMELQGNVTNLFNKRYVSTLGSNGFGNSGDSQTLLAGAPRQFLATLRAGL